MLFRSGMAYNGLLVSQDEEEVVLMVDEDGKMEEFVFYPDEIAQMQKQDVSIMPGNFSEMLTTKEFYGIISFLLSQK